MGTFINPFSDFGFKKIFGQEVSKDILIDFLNCLLKGERHISDIEFLDKERSGDTIDSRVSIYDLYCRTDSGEYIIVEMQNSKQENFLSRMLYYVARSISRQGDKGVKWEYNVQAVYGIAFMNFKVNSLTKFRTDTTTCDMETGKQVIDKMRMIFLQLPLFPKDKIEDCVDEFEKWIYILKNMETFNRLPKEAQRAVFKKLASIASLAELSPEERIAYDHDIKVYRDILTIQNEEKRRIEDAETRGEQRGMEQGKIQEKLEIARTMLDNNAPLDLVILYTGLTADQIADLINKKPKGSA